MAVTAEVAGTGPLVRRALRRDRLLVGGWLLVLTAVVGASAGATASLYPTVASRVAAASAIDASPAVVALYGPLLDVRSLGELAMTKTTVLYAVLVALLAVVLVRRHTRGEEESGRAELVGATAVGRDAPLAAALLEAGLVSLAAGVLAAVADAASGLPVAGSLAFGAAWTGTGLVGAGLAAVACQLSASTRTCGALAAAAVAALYLLRAVGDTAVPALGWVSPLGWSTRLRAWGETRWWVLLLHVGLTALLVGLAVVLRRRRDLGAGLVHARPGPAAGGPTSPAGVWSLPARLAAPGLLGWSAALLLTGGLLGAVARDAGALLDSPSARALVERLGGRGALGRSLLAAELSVAAVVVTCAAIAVVGRATADEREGRTQLVLATTASRAGVLLSTALVALLGATWLLLLTGVGVVLGGGTPGTGAGETVLAALAQAPAVWLVTALALAAHAVGVRWAPAGWVLLVAFLTLGQLGELLRLPGWVVGLSPYAHAGRVPAEPFAPLPALATTLLAVVVLAGAVAAYRSRDVG